MSFSDYCNKSEDFLKVKKELDKLNKFFGKFFNSYIKIDEYRPGPMDMPPRSTYEITMGSRMFSPILRLFRHNCNIFPVCGYYHLSFSTTPSDALRLAFSRLNRHFRLSETGYLSFPKFTTASELIMKLELMGEEGRRKIFCQSKPAKNHVSS